MNQITLNSILSRFSELAEIDRKDILQSIKEYPYSQVLHIVIARASRDLQSPLEQQFLSTASIYCTDRGVLKEMMDAPRSTKLRSYEETSTMPFSERKDNPVTDAPEQYHTEWPSHTSADRNESETLREPENTHYNSIENAESEEPLKTEERDFHETEPASFSLGDDYYLNIEKDLAALLQSRLTYEEVASTVHPENWGKKKKKDAPAAKAKSTPSAGTPKAKKKKTVDPADNLLDEIKKKKETAPRSEKQKVQAEIIENFIKKKQRISPPTDETGDIPPPADETLSSVLQKDVASETLVNILVEQGKIETAIETLKKLIWKYPHKKPYFAAKIQSLKR